MGDPRRIRKKYNTPSHPWQKARIEEEKVLSKEYGVKNKKEIWKMGSVLKDFKDQAKALVARTDTQAEKERKLLFGKLERLGLLGKEAKLDDILGLTVNNVMDRRLQTLLYKKGLARSINQARQFIVHQHVFVGNKPNTSPSYLVPLAEEAAISFVSNSPLANEAHPERAVKEQPKKAPEAVEAEVQ